MPPLVVNEGLGKPIQVVMGGSVGAGGANHAPDVVTVQSLLNAVPAVYGGANPLLTVDGFIGPKTVGAIQTFQVKQLGFADGRIDVGQQTIRRLVGLTQVLNSVPHNAPGLVPPPQAVSAGLQGVKSVNQSGRSFTSRKSTKWRLVTTAGITGSVSWIGASFAYIHIISDAQPDVVYELAFLGVGVSLSTMPAGLDIAFADLPSMGTRLWQLQGLATPLNVPDDFLGQCMIISQGMSAGPGGSATFVLFNMGLTAFGGLTGLHIGASGVGITGLMGAIAGWK